MSKKISVDELGQLIITVTPSATITTMTKEEVIGKKAEAQTKVDHLNIDLAEAQAEVTKWDGHLKKMEKQWQTL